jgi:prolyl-tRNA synthetase
VDKHLVNANWNMDLPLPTEFSDIRLARIGDTCPECQNGALEMTRGIEVGNIFQLGTKYSEKMQATYTAEDGTEQPFIMGCYGIGVTRTAAAAIERFHDKNGMIWPMAIAPYKVVVVPVNVLDDTQMTLALQVYEQLQAAGVEVMLDDRDERAGVKFKDADLIGYPIRVTAGKKAADGLLEVKLRDADQPQDMAAGDVLAFVQAQIQSWKPCLEKALTPLSK